MSTIGERVIAISHTSDDGKTVYIFGHGVYEGDEVPTSASGQLGQMLNAANVTNPKIALDSGKVVWGCECWHGSEDKVLASFEHHGQTVEVIDIDESRAKHAPVPDEVEDDIVAIETQIGDEYPELAGIKKLLETAVRNCVGIKLDDVVPAVNSEVLGCLGYLQTKGAIVRVTYIETRVDDVGVWNETSQEWDNSPEVGIMVEFVLPQVNSEATEERKVGLDLTLKKLTTEVSSAHPPSVE